MRHAKIGLFLYFLFVFSLSAAALEIGARFKYQKNYLATNIRMDRIYHHLPSPYTTGAMSSENDFDSTFTTNNRGMRGPGDYAYEKKPGIYRIAVMGDSFTFGVGVEADQTYSSLLQKKLEAAGAADREVLNFGVSSFSPVLEYVYLKREVVRYRPDLLILALDLCDVQDDYMYEPHLVYDRDGQILACDPYRLGGGWDVWAYLKHHSVFCAILDEKLVQSFEKMRAIGFRRYFENKKQGLRNKSEILENPDLDNIAFDRFIFTRENKNAAIVERHWRRTAKYLKMIKALCDAHSIRFVLTSYPYGQEVGTNQWTKGRQYWAFSPDKVYSGARPFNTIRAFAKENDIEFVSLLEPMLAHNREKLYYNNDGHWTAAGHRVAAQALFDALYPRKS